MVEDGTAAQKAQAMAKVQGIALGAPKEHSDEDAEEVIEDATEEEDESDISHTTILLKKYAPYAIHSITSL
jgi:hypothetical protein